MAETARRWARRDGMALMLAVFAIGAAMVIWYRGRPIEGLDIPYGEAGGRTLLLDVYRPTGASTSRPGVLLIHGGGWVEGDKSMMREMAEVLNRAGFVAISIGYRLAKNGSTRHPAQVDDVRRAARWVRAHAASIGVDPDRLGAYGHSAGGHLAAILGTTDAKGDGDPNLSDYSSRVQCVVDCCGPADFTDETSPAVGPAIGWLIPNLFGMSRGEVPDAYRDASPVAQVDSKAAPTLIIHGTADEIVPLGQSRKFRDALARAGVEAKLIEVEGEGHLFLKPESRDLMIRETLDFLGKSLKP